MFSNSEGSLNSFLMRRVYVSEPMSMLPEGTFRFSAAMTWEMEAMDRP